ncbi:ABC transporter ATP-binding protein [Clostridium gasigenes]|uniref:ABC transporter ATP-binding protein n=1 Tax=Clostridium gasigenes TaxID=94869 RepID=UPI0014385BA1|nr:ABC transporter ATP-binding protein [Clostridium gasigenes]NKF08838.1 ABC transporter ATP-binding protein [Clostridium gasigenes]QSW21250.1 ABC transporter ATP-binding protein [Clostridium gasigenes]
MKESIIKTSNLYKSFKIGRNSVDILKNINLTVEKGEFVSIMGPSGCGKSTLLYLLGGLDNPTKGDIYFGEKNYKNIKSNHMGTLRRRDMGFVFQFYNLVQNLNVEDNILLPILLDGKKAKNYEKELKDILKIIGLEDKRRHTPSELSGGQQQRVAIARALISKPKLILADEPIGNLDSKSGEDIMNLLRCINKDLGNTIIQVTHSMESSEYGTRIINIRDGEIEKDSKNNLKCSINY